MENPPDVAYQITFLSRFLILSPGKNSDANNVTRECFPFSDKKVCFSRQHSNLFVVNARLGNKYQIDAYVLLAVGFSSAKTSMNHSQASKTHLEREAKGKKIALIFWLSNVCLFMFSDWGKKFEMFVNNSLVKMFFVLLSAVDLLWLMLGSGGRWRRSDNEKFDGFVRTRDVKTFDFYGQWQLRKKGWKAPCKLSTMSFITIVADKLLRSKDRKSESLQFWNCINFWLPFSVKFRAHKIQFFYRDVVFFWF